MSSFRRALWALGWPARAVLLALVFGYRRTFRGALGGRCRFHPSCSAYAAQAIRAHGATKGSILSIWRVLRCSPLTIGGPDPVPPPGARRSARRPSRVPGSMTLSYSKGEARVE
jgi:putative membrane protein insertion efficiency factor